MRLAIRTASRSLTLVWQPDPPGGDRGCAGPPMGPPRVARRRLLRLSCGSFAARGSAGAALPLGSRRAAGEVLPRAPAPWRGRRRRRRREEGQEEAEQGEDEEDALRAAERRPPHTRDRAVAL